MTRVILRPCRSTVGEGLCFASLELICDESPGETFADGALCKEHVGELFTFATERSDDE